MERITSKVGLDGKRRDDKGSNTRRNGTHEKAVRLSTILYG